MPNFHFITLTKLMIISLIFLIIPLSAFNLPKNQMELEGFDPKLIDIDNPNDVTLNTSTLILAATPESTPFVTTVTTPSSFTVSVEATVIKQEGKAMPMQIDIWDARTSDAFSIWFVSPGNVIFCGARKSTDEWETIIEVGKYVENSSYSIRISFFTSSYIEFSVTNSTWSNSTRIENVTILKRPIVNLSFFATAFEAESISILRKYRIEIPSQSYYNYFTNLLDGNLNWAYAILFVLVFILWRRDFFEALNRIVGFARRIGYRTRHSGKEKWLIVILFSSSIILQLSVSFIGSQPYDSFAQKAWAYISTQYGLEYLYPLSLIAPSGRSVGTLSIISLTYSYPPLLGYVYLMVGRLYASISPEFDFSTPLFGLLLKMPWIITTSILGLLIYFFTRKTFSAKVAFVLTSLYVFNPCVVFESAIWSQSDAILASFLILSVLALRSNSIRGMWFFVGLSLLSKQTAVVPAALISFFALRRFGLHKTIKSLAFPFVCIFFLVGPYLLLGYSPSFIFNVSLGQNVLNIIIERPQRVAEWQIVASAGAHNVWPVLTALLDGQSGWSRFAYPDYISSQIMGTSYARFGSYLVLICFVLVFIQSLISEKSENQKESPAFYLLYIAIFSLYMFFTRMSARYLYLAIPFLIMSFNWIRSKKVFALLFGTLTSTFFLSVYSYLTLTSVWQQSFLPNFHPNANLLNSVMVQFLTNDTYITVLCLANLSLFILSMLFSIFRILDKGSHIGRNRMQGESECCDSDFLLPNCLEKQRDSESYKDRKTCMYFLSENYKPRWFPTKLWHLIMIFYRMVFTDYIQLILKREFKQCSSFLELGCGKGSPATSLVRNFNLCVGVDLHRPSLRKNKRKRYFKDYVLADIRHPPFKSHSFDCVVALDVIEHLSKPDGYRLMERMENISLKKVAILTPNGCCPKQHIEDSNILQHHRSAWVLSEFLSRSYTVFGINGIRALRGEQGHATIKPRLIGHSISKLTDRFVYNYPQIAFQLLCIKSKSKTGK